MSDSPKVADNTVEADDGEEQTVTTAPILGVEVEDYEDESTPPKTQKMIAIVAHLDDITADLEDEDDDASEGEEDSSVESADSEEDEEFTLGKFREATKDLPDTTPMVLTTIIPDDDEDSQDDDDEPTEAA